VSLAPTSDIPLELARAAVRARLHPPAAAHCERTAATARVLASRFGVDERAAELAGMLHDWSREEPDAALLAYADMHGLSVLDEERARVSPPNSSVRTFAGSGSTCSRRSPLTPSVSCR
jgi:predicted hydrolase (HD superfamily)